MYFEEIQSYFPYIECVLSRGVDSYTQRYDICRYFQKLYDTVTIRFRSIIDRYIDIMILYTYFKQPSTFLITHKCNQKYITWK